jgi:hypothetical protein
VEIWIRGMQLQAMTVIAKLKAAKETIKGMNPKDFLFQTMAVIINRVKEIWIQYSQQKDVDNLLLIAEGELNESKKELAQSQHRLQVLR